jgi:hypothetical protein
MSALTTESSALWRVPSPLAGEGGSAGQQYRPGEGSGRFPSPNRVCCTVGAALSRKGRGHNGAAALAARHSVVARP